MKLEVKSLVEVVGIIAVVGSLIFVGLQLQLERRAATGEQYSNRANAYQAQLMSQLESEAYLSTYSKRWENGVRPPWYVEGNAVIGNSTVTAVDVEVMRLSMLTTLVGMDNLYFQYQQGLMSNDQWQVRRQRIKESLQDVPQLRAFFTDRTVNTYIIYDLFLEILAEIEND